MVSIRMGVLRLQAWEDKHGHEIPRRCALIHFQIAESDGAGEGKAMCAHSIGESIHATQCGEKRKMDDRRRRPSEPDPRAGQATQAISIALHSGCGIQMFMATGRILSWIQCCGSNMRAGCTGTDRKTEIRYSPCRLECWSARRWFHGGECDEACAASRQNLNSLGYFM